MALLRSFSSISLALTLLFCAVLAERSQLSKDIAADFAEYKKQNPDGNALDMALSRARAREII